MAHLVFLRPILPKSSSDTAPLLDLEMQGLITLDSKGRKTSGYARGRSVELKISEFVHGGLHAQRMSFAAVIDGTSLRIECMFEPEETGRVFAVEETPTYWLGVYKGPPSIGEGTIRACLVPVRDAFLQGMTPVKPDEQAFAQASGF
jgi:hypothetical protein